MENAAHESQLARLLTLVRVAALRVLALARMAPDLAALIVMAIAGIGVSAYLTIVHYAKTPLVCPGYVSGGFVNCERVTSSAYSVVPGTQLPITVPGFVWFAVSGGLALVAFMRLTRNQPEPDRLRLAHALWGAVGLLFVLYLVYAEVAVLHNLCAWCTIVHILTFLTFLVALARLTMPADAPRIAPARGQGKRVPHSTTTTRVTRNHAQGRAISARAQKARNATDRSRRHR